ncbi:MULTISPECIES: hypothetical protein [unclassified Methylobacterium]|uniref:hypothetical protein n=1 Tax=unclassified Methylobacterium TaxID=2615210 RepID=UPI0036FBEA95
MSTDHTALTDAAVHEILFATMPDGSPITPSVKVDAMLAAAGIDTVPATLRAVIARGVSQWRGAKHGRKGQAHV